MNRLHLAFLVAGLMTLAATSDAAAHGERAQEGFLRMETVAFRDVTFSSNAVTPGQDLTISGTATILDSWPETLADPKVGYVNVEAPGPVMLMKDGTVNGMPAPDAIFIRKGDTYQFSMRLEARRPGRWHIHPTFAIEGAGTLIGPGAWITVQDTGMNRLSRLLGYEPADLQGAFSLESVHPADWSEVSRIWAELVEQPGNMAKFRYRERQADNTWRWVDATGANLRNEPSVGAVVINRRDITDEIETQLRLEDQVAIRTRELESLYRADAILRRSLNLNDVLQALVDVAADMLGMPRSAVFVFDEHSGRMALGAVRGFERAAVEQLQAAFDDGIAASLRQNRAPVTLPEALAVPVRAGDQLFGIVCVADSLPRGPAIAEPRPLVALAERAGLAIELESDPARVGRLLGDVLHLTETGLVEMRALIFELRPESLATEGLVSALEKQSAAVVARHRLEIHTTLDTEPNAPLSHKEVVYRVAQEALHNIAKHARASHVHLNLEVGVTEMQLSVRDDGHGFDPATEYPGHLGLRSMRERAAAVGGMLRVESHPGHGTRVSLRVPLQTPELGVQTSLAAVEAV